jgi:hypothetical protein
VLLLQSFFGLEFRCSSSLLLKILTLAHWSSVEHDDDDGDDDHLLL